MRVSLSWIFFLLIVLQIESYLPAADKTPVGQVNYLKAATDFADCMIDYGRDRYGKSQSPLFAVFLIRDPKPEIGPQPYFDRPCPYKTDNMNTPFREHNYNRCLNYPKGLGSEGPHKITLYGCDPYEDQELYNMLIDLTRITGDPKYKQEAEKALDWWFRNTQSPETGLYPWGEHLGWDFENECPTYFEGPSKHLYAACYHEVKDRIPFLDFLAEIPTANPEEFTPLEKYALGVWKYHYWDKERAIYCRHGDYTGKDNRKGSYDGFPAHQGAHLRLWVKTYCTTRNESVKKEMEEILNKVLDIQISRSRKFGFVPFTFKPDYTGARIDKKVPGQSIRLAEHAAELATVIDKTNPEIAAKLKELARIHLGEKGLNSTQKMVDDKTPPAATPAKLADNENCSRHASEITRRIEWYRQYGDKKYLDAALEQAGIAYGLFMDNTCPLPKGFNGPPPKTLKGDTSMNFYFRGAGLMHAFALLGEAESDR